MHSYSFINALHYYCNNRTDLNTDAKAPINLSSKELYKISSVHLLISNQLN